MRTFVKFMKAAALLGAFISTPALADGDCSSCQPDYSTRLSSCDAYTQSDESKNLCYSRASSNLDACNATCSYATSDSDDSSTNQ